MATKIIKEIVTDVGGNTTIEYSDDTVQKYNVADVVTAQTNPVTGGIANLKASGRSAISDLGLRQIGNISRITVIGDSIAADAFSATSIWTNWGYIAWARRFLGNRVDISSSRMFAVGGSFIHHARDLQLPQALASGADACIVATGVNSLGSKTTDALIAEYVEIYTALRSAGVFVIAIPIRCTRGVYTMPADNLFQASRINTWMRDYCEANMGMKFFDPNPIYLNYATGLPRADYLRDDLHDNQASAYAMGKALANFISPLLPAQDNSFAWLGDVFDAAKNPSGNLLLNGLMIGTGGSVVNGATGSTPNSWMGARSTGSATHSAAFAVGTDPDNSYLPRATVTLGGTADTNSCFLAAERDITSLLSVGDFVTGQAEVDFNCAAGIYNIGLEVLFWNASYQALASAQDGYLAMNGALAAVNDKVTLRTEPLAVPSGAKFMNFQLNISPQRTGTPSGVVGIKRASIRKI